MLKITSEVTKEEPIFEPYTITLQIYIDTKQDQEQLRKELTTGIWSNNGSANILKLINILRQDLSTL